MKLINASNDQQTVEIILASGVKDSINLQPRGRATPPFGSKVDPDKEKQYTRFLKIKTEPSDQATPAVLTSTPAFVKDDQSKAK